MGTHDCKTKIMTEFYVGGIWTGDWTSVMSDPREFVFSPSTPLYDFRLSIGTAVVFLGVIAVLHWMMKGRPAMSLPWISNVHNLILSVWSLVMHVGILYGVWEKYISQGRPLMDLLCDKDPEPMTGTLAYFCWMYYVSKYYELFDTVLMVVKHKPLTVLHLWHHAVIGPMSLSWLRGNWDAPLVRRRRQHPHPRLYVLLLLCRQGLRVPSLVARPHHPGPDRTVLLCLFPHLGLCLQVHPVAPRLWPRPRWRLPPHRPL